MTIVSAGQTRAWDEHFIPMVPKKAHQGIGYWRKYGGVWPVWVDVGMASIIRSNLQAHVAEIVPGNLYHFLLVERSEFCNPVDAN